MTGVVDCGVFVEWMMAVWVEQLTDAYDKQTLMLGTEAGGVLWYRPSSLPQLLSLKAQHRDARLVSGATTVGLLI